MYNSAPTLAATGTAGTLALTGANVLWVALAGFALLSAGLAIMRVIPRKQE